MTHSTSRLLAALLLTTATQVSSADVVLEWNRVAADVLRDNVTLQDPGNASRSMAMMNLAIYDAYMMTTPGTSMFYNYGDGRVSPGYDASAQAAVAQAAHTVLSSIYGDQQAALDAALSASLSQVASGTRRDAGMAIGDKVGQSIISRRASDGFDSNSQYMPTSAPGRWQPDPLNPGQEAWGPVWGNVATFALTSGDQFTAPPMPDLASPEYTAAFNEVKELGSVNSASRTADQEEIGIFWAYDREGLGTPHRLFNRVLDTIAVQQGNTELENAQLFAMASVAMADAGVAAWESKFEYDFWRPVTGIRDAALDGNPDTIADPNWTPLGAPGGNGTDFTPPFPTYVSGHATFGGALFAVLQEFYGTDELAFTLESEELPGVTRDYMSFSQAMAENGRSRVYLGIHWNFDDTVGQQLGADIGRYIMSQPFASPIPEPAAMLLSCLGVAATALRRARRA